MPYGTMNSSSDPYSLEQLCALTDPKSIEAVRNLGDIKRLETGLKTDLKSGLKINEDHSERVQKYGDNVLPDRPSKSFLQLVWTAFNDKVLIILSIAAVVSLAVGLYQTLGIEHAPNQPKIEWVEGVAIIAAISIVVLVGSVNDYQKEKAFAKLNKKREDRRMAVLRGGQEQQTSIFELLVGDILRFQTGDVLPVDGLLLEGLSVKCDESSQTGEIDSIEKATIGFVFSSISSASSSITLKEQGDPILLSGSKVVDGSGTMLVTAVGIHSTYGSIMMSLRDGDAELTPLQSKLNAMAESIAKWAIGSAILYFTACFIRFLVRLTSGNLQNASPTKKGQVFLDIFIESVSIVAVAIPEGLPLAVTLALAIATTRMYRDNNLVRMLRSCETMGNATTICSDKTGTLTQNMMTVVVGNLGGSGDFAFGTNPTKPADKEARTKVQESSVNRDGSHITINNLHSDVKALFSQSIVINSTASEEGAEGSGSFGGSRTEVALLQFAQNSLGVKSVRGERAMVTIKSAIPFNSFNKYMATLVELPSGKKGSAVYRVFVKGAPDVLLKLCSRVLVRPNNGLADQPLSPEKVRSIQGLQNDYAERSLRTLCVIYKDYTSWPAWFPEPGAGSDENRIRNESPRPSRPSLNDTKRPSSVRKDSNSRKDSSVNAKSAPASDESKMGDMTFIGMVGIQDPVREGVLEAVDDCRTAGVVVRMVTGDNLATAKAIALDAGILSNNQDDIVMEGSEFRKMSDRDMDDMLPRLRVLARSTPEDKRVLVQHLRGLGETVAVTGDGTNDAPALKLADVGFAMGSGTEVAKEASDIILLDDDFASIVKALLWGRTINDAVKKFVQFQLTVNITAVITTFASGVFIGVPVMSAVQLLWLNLIMDTLAALALATDSPTRSLLDRKPERRDAAFISIPMWKMIIGQAIFQLIIVFLLLFTGPDTLFSWLGSDLEERWNTTIFNTFVWLQIFNAFNCRRVDNRWNIFEGLLRNYYFLCILCVMIGGQFLIIFVGGPAFQAERLDLTEWIISIIPGFLTLPIGLLIRAVPDEWAANCIPAFVKRRLSRKKKTSAAKQAHLDEEAQTKGWDEEALLNELKFLKSYKGGRVSSMKWKLNHPKESRRRSANGNAGLPSISALVAGSGVVAGSVGGVRR